MLVGIFAIVVTILGLGLLGGIRSCAGRSSMSSEGAMYRANPARTGVYDAAAVDTLEQVKKYEIGGLVVKEPLVYQNSIIATVDVAGKLQVPILMLKAVDRGTGDLKWQFNLVSTSPAIAGGTVYVGKYEEGIVAVDAETGQQQWLFETRGDIKTPAVVDGVVYFGTYSGILYAVDAVTGRSIWRFKVPEPSYEGRSAYVRLVEVFDTAVADDTVYFGSRNGYLYAIDAKTGKKKWSWETGQQVVTGPTVSGGMLYVGVYDKGFFAIDAGTGKEIWRFEGGNGSRFYSPALWQGMVFFGVNDGKLYALDAKTGQRRWDFQTGAVYPDDDPRNPVFRIGPPAIASGILYFGDASGVFHALDAKDGSEKWRLQAGDGAGPAGAADGTIYFGSAEKVIYAIQ